MPQVFGAEELGLISQASLWLEAAASEADIEKATHPEVAAEARRRGLVPLRMSADPIWHHPESGKIITLTPAHSGDDANYTSIANLRAKMKREYPTAEETARASRTPEEVEADQAAAAAETRSKKQQAVDAAKRARDRAEAVAAKSRAQTEQIAFEKEHGPFRNMDEVQTAYNARSSQVKASRPGDTVEAFAGRLRTLPPGHRQQVHKLVFPERYK